MILDRDFYAQEATTVARALLGAILVRQIGEQRITGRIVETEAYRTTDDLASHGRDKPTQRNRPMWGAPGHTYVYLIYGMYWLLNAVCEPVDHPAAALIRAIEPLEGRDLIAANRPGRPPREWTNGPGRLSLGLNITGDQNMLDLTTPASGLWIESGDPLPDEAVCTGPRIGLGRHVTEPWLSIPWRWWIDGNPHVSR
jgi:DNA-3-methyladenine glycosylase